LKNLNKFFYKKKILITGHTGFSGSWLTYVLKFFGANIYGLALKEKNQNAFYNILNIKKYLSNEYIFDIRNKTKVKKILKKINPEIIFHLAAQPIVSEAYKDTPYTFETNVLGTINLLDACKSLNKLKSIVVVTSDKCYRNEYYLNKKFNESHPLGANDPYSTSKAAQELVVETFRNYIFKNKKFYISTARAGNIIGGGDFAINRIVPDYFRAINQKKNLIIRNPNSTRPWQYILDVIFGYIKLSKMQNKSIEGAWNFGPDQNNINVKKLIGILNKINGFKVKIKFKKNIIKESKYLNLDSSKSKKKLRWKPKYKIKTILELTSEWYGNINNKKIIKKVTQNHLINYIKDLNK
tara:strand:+ start:340 stop:1398 length:1059 start_codon:yes stop_codon:yes gene_type:complete